MIIELGLTGNDRKELVKAVSEIIGATAEYQYMPTCAYIIGGHYTITKEGNLDIRDTADSKEVEKLIDELVRRGYDIPTVDKNLQNDDEASLTVEIPKDRIDDATVDRLRKIVENKGELFKAAFKTDNLKIEVTDEKVCFPWFTVEQYDDATAYSNFICLLCEFAKIRSESTTSLKQQTIRNTPCDAI